MGFLGDSDILCLVGSTTRCIGGIGILCLDANGTLDLDASSTLDLGGSGVLFFGERGIICIGSCSILCPEGTKVSVGVDDIKILFVDAPVALDAKCDGNSVHKLPTQRNLKVGHLCEQGAGGLLELFVFLHQRLQ